MVARSAGEGRERESPRRKSRAGKERPEEVRSHPGIVAEPGDGRDASPVIKWAGGKGQLLAGYRPYVPERFTAYHEPFVGGAALFFELRRRGLADRASLSDSNADLVNLYRVLRDHVAALVGELGREEFVYDEAAFYAVRGWEPAELHPVRAAARLVYLNHTCFNGLYRLNSKGRFNVPFGRHHAPRICDAVALRAASAALQGVEIGVRDFEEACGRASPGDLVYLDPPYQPLRPTSSFTSYDRNGFGEGDQVRLADCFRRLDEQGVLVLLSNSDTPLVRELYRGYDQVELQARRSINSRGSGRRPVTELLVRGRAAAARAPAQRSVISKM